MSREDLVHGAVSGVGNVAGRMAAERVVDGLIGGDELPGAAAADGMHPYTADVITVVNMTKNNLQVIRRLNNVNAALSEGVRDRMAHYLQPMRVRRAFLGLDSERWSYRFPNLKDQSAIARTSRYYHTQNDQRFRELYVTCADFAINCYAHERTRVIKKMKIRRKNDQINNRKVFFIAQLLNMLYVIFDEFKTSANKTILVANLRQVMDMCQGIIDECEGGSKLWRSGGEAVSFPGTLQQISHTIHTTIKEYERPELPSPVEATESLIESLDHFSEASLMMSLSHMLDRHVPMNAVYLLKKMHHIAMLAESGDPLYEVLIEDECRARIMTRCRAISKLADSKRNLADHLYLELFSSITDATAKFNEKQMMYLMLVERDASRFDTPSHNRRELEPLLNAFRSDDAQQQAMLYRLFYFVTSDFRDLSYAVYDYNRIPSEFRQQSIRDLGLAPLSDLPSSVIGGEDTEHKSVDAAPYKPSIEAISSVAERVLAELNQVVATPVDRVNHRMQAFEKWVRESKEHPVGIVQQLASKPGLSRVLSEYQDGLIDMVACIKQIEKVVATLRVAVMLFKNLGQADINSLSGVIHSVIQVSEQAINQIAAVMRKLSRSGEHSYVNTLIQNTMYKGKRDANTKQWHDNLVRVNHYAMSALINQLAENTNLLKRALTRSPDDHLAVRIGLFVKGVESLFGMQLSLPPQLATLMQNQAIREMSGKEPVVAIPARMLDDIKQLLGRVQVAEPSESAREAADREKGEDSTAISALPPRGSTRELINAISRFLEYALRSYDNLKHSSTGKSRARQQIRHWLGELSFTLCPEDTVPDIVAKWFQLMTDRITQRRKKANLPLVTFDIKSFELHAALLLVPHLNLPVNMHRVSDDLLLPSSHQECLCLIERIAAGGLSKQQIKQLSQQLMFVLRADAFNQQTFTAQAWQQMVTPVDSPLVQQGLFAKTTQQTNPQIVQVRATGVGLRRRLA